MLELISIHECEAEMFPQIKKNNYVNNQQYCALQLICELSGK